MNDLNLLRKDRTFGALDSFHCIVLQRGFERVFIVALIFDFDQTGPITDLYYWLQSGGPVDTGLDCYIEWQAVRLCNRHELYIVVGRGEPPQPCYSTVTL